MASLLNREEFEKLIGEDLAWLRKQPRTLERDHIEQIVNGAAAHYYGVIMFPIAAPEGSDCPTRIPWGLVAPYEGNALRNHDQSLKRLAQRGGLDPLELYWIMNGLRWRGGGTMEIATAFIKKKIADAEAGTR